MWKPWIERKFETDLPGWMFPQIVERLRGTPARLEDRVAGIAGEILVRRDGDAWSVQEHVGHLGDLEDLHYGRMQDFAEGKEVLRAADITNKATFAAKHNLANMENLLDRFRAKRMRLIDLLEKMSEADVLKTSLHPRLKTPMKVIDSCYFWAEHDDHHLAQMTRLILKFTD